MPLVLGAPNATMVVEPELLTGAEFSMFGTVIENPAPKIVPSPRIKQLPPNAVHANQGSALKYQDVTQMQDLYVSAPSTQPGRAVMNMFVCAPRPLLPSSESHINGHFPVTILERHPYTSQTFVPLGLSPVEQQEARYLVIVALSLPPSPADENLPFPLPTLSSGPLPGRGLPDIGKIRAFIAKGSQAVTYGAGTWHAPMVAVGSRSVDFVVVQFVNGVSQEDCQEVEIEGRQGSQILVAIPRPMDHQSHAVEIGESVFDPPSRKLPYEGRRPMYTATRDSIIATTTTTTKREDEQESVILVNKVSIAKHPFPTPTPPHIPSPDASHRSGMIVAIANFGQKQIETAPKRQRPPRKCFMRRARDFSMCQ
ncbi:hypothetical protein B7494_g8334 [Chlorociboria aeruginascens]|nr:hypothetical protein B7494_g8334 [Chlorociboria aeruginascens]